MFTELTSLRKKHNKNYITKKKQRASLNIMTKCY